MRAELQGKLDVEGSLATERLEDSLTDAVASALLYTDPAAVLAPVLRCLFPAASDDITDEEVARAEVELWPRFTSGTEPDIVIRAAGWILIVEAKYTSGFGGGTSNDATPQLVREWRGGREQAKATGLNGPLLTAVTKDPVEPVEVGHARDELRAEILSDCQLEVSDAIQWTPWREVAAVLRAAKPDLTPPDRRLVTDVLRIMERRGVATMFTGIDPQHMQQLTAAHQVAVAQVTPAIAELADELESLLAHDEIVWGSANSGVWRWGRSDARNRADLWPMDHVTLPWWPSTWPARIGNPKAALICQVDFARGAVHIGHCQWTGSRSQSAGLWATKSGPLATALSSLPDDTTVAVDDRWSARTNTRPASDVDAAWLEHGLRSHRTLWITKSFDVSQLNTAQAVREQLVQTRTWIDNRPIVLDLLRAAQLVEPAEPTA